MSIAGARSTFGDYYQNAIALHWFVELLQDENIDYVQTDSTGLPDSDATVTVDDIVIKYKMGKISYRFIQAKSYSPKKESWTIETLCIELLKAKSQLNNFPKAVVQFISQSPFGEFGRLLSSCHFHPHLQAMKNTGEKEPLNLLSSLAKLIGVPLDDAFCLIRHIEVGEHFTTQGWNTDTKRALGRLFANSEKVFNLLEGEISKLNCKTDGKFSIRRSDLLGTLELAGCFMSPTIDVAAALESFSRSSSATTHWAREIGGQRIDRAKSTTSFADQWEEKCPCPGGTR